MEFFDYPLMTEDTFLRESRKNPYTKGEFGKKIFRYFDSHVADPLNDHLRQEVPLETVEQDLFQLLHEACEQRELPENVTVFRLLRFRYLEGYELTEGETLYRQYEKIKKKTGARIVEKAFSSTSIRLDRNPLIFTKERPYLLILQVKKGTKAFVSGNREEGEILFDAGMEYTVKEVNDHITSPLQVPVLPEGTGWFHGIVIRGRVE